MSNERIEGVEGYLLELLELAVPHVIDGQLEREIRDALLDIPQQQTDSKRLDWLMECPKSLCEKIESREDIDYHMAPDCDVCKGAGGWEDGTRDPLTVGGRVDPQAWVDCEHCDATGKIYEND